MDPKNALELLQSCTSHPMVKVSLRDNMDAGVEASVSLHTDALPTMVQASLRDDIDAGVEASMSSHTERTQLEVDSVREKAADDCKKV